LLGCSLYLNGAGGTIVEAEAYGPDDPACHAYRGRTDRNAPLFGPPGSVYVYRSYGIHMLLNLVSESEGRPAAVLIRALEPDAGLEHMRRRRGRKSEVDLCSGPGKVGQALGIDPSMNGYRFDHVGFVIERPASPVDGTLILSGPRIGISRAKERPWRFHLADSKYVSRPRLASG
jgi:DNA-3-methyladenine glycosylase